MPWIRRVCGFDYPLWWNLRHARNPRQIVKAMRDAFLFHGHRRSHRRPLIKDPIAFLSTPWLSSRLHAQVVMLARHPAAFAGSLAVRGRDFDFGNFTAQEGLLDGPLAPWCEQIQDMARGGGDPLERACVLWCVFHGLMRDWKAAHPDWVVIRHEDIAARPMSAFPELCGQIDLDVGPHYLQALERALGDTGRADDLQSTRRHSAAQASSWRSRLQIQDISRIRSLTEAIWPTFYREDEW